jgi:hypothetical protein
MCPFAQNYFLKKNDVKLKGRLGGAGAFSQIFPKLKNKKFINNYFANNSSALI